MMVVTGTDALEAKGIERKMEGILLARRGNGGRGWSRRGRWEISKEICIWVFFICRKVPIRFHHLRIFFKVARIPWMTVFRYNWCLWSRVRYPHITCQVNNGHLPAQSYPRDRSNPPLETIYVAWHLPVLPIIASQFIPLIQQGFCYLPLNFLNACYGRLRGGASRDLLPRDQSGLGTGPDQPEFSRIFQMNCRQRTAGTFLISG